MSGIGIVGIKRITPERGLEEENGSFATGGVKGRTVEEHLRGWVDLHHVVGEGHCENDAWREEVRGVEEKKGTMKREIEVRVREWKEERWW